MSMTRIVAAAISIALILSTTPIAAEEQADESFRYAGEEFYYSLRLNGVEAIRVGVRAGDVQYKKGTPYVPVSGTAQSTGFFDSVYSVNDKANTFLHPTTFRPLRSEKVFDENGSRRTYKVDFTHSTYRAKVEKAKEQRTRKFTASIPGTTHDMISWFYELRSQEIAQGDELSFFVYDGWKLSRIRGKVAGKEDIYTPMGWFKTWRIDFERDVMHSRRNRGQEPTLRVKAPSKLGATMWVSRDENRVPVKMRIKTAFGQGEALILKFKIPKD